MEVTYPSPCCGFCGKVNDLHVKTVGQATHARRSDMLNFDTPSQKEKMVRRLMETASGAIKNGLSKMTTRRKIVASTRHQLVSVAQMMVAFCIL